MSPSLVLLIDNSEETFFKNIGTVLLKNLLNEDYEVRQNVLQVVHTMSLYSQTSKYMRLNHISTNSCNDIIFEKMFSNNKLKSVFSDLLTKINFNGKPNHTILEIPAFKDVLLNSNFAEIVFAVAVDDVNNSVKASALRCLQTMLQIDDIRRRILNITNIYVRKNLKTLHMLLPNL